jgi:hypothetical protein
MLKPLIAFCLLSALLSSCNVTTQVSGPLAVTKNRTIIERSSGNDNHFAALSAKQAQSIVYPQSFLAIKMEPSEMAQAD